MIILSVDKTIIDRVIIYCLYNYLTGNQLYATSITKKIRV